MPRVAIIGTGLIGASIGLVGVYWGNAAFLGAGALFNAKARRT